MSAYHFKYFQNIQFKNHGIAPTPPDLPTLKAFPTPGVGGRLGIVSLKWRERMNLKVTGAILPLGCAILSTRAKTVRGVVQPPLGELGLTVRFITYQHHSLHQISHYSAPLLMPFDHGWLISFMAVVLMTQTKTQVAGLQKLKWLIFLCLTNTNPLR